MNIIKKSALCEETGKTVSVRFILGFIKRDGRRETYDSSERTE